MTRVVRGLRWWIAGLIFVALTVAESGPATAHFLVAYSLSQALSGKLYDGIGNKSGFAAFENNWRSHA